MNVLHVVDKVDGGLGTYIWNLARYQSQDDNITEVHLAVPRFNDGRTPPDIEAMPNVHIHFYDVDKDSLKSEKSGAEFERIYSELDGIVQEVQPSVIHAHNGMAGGFARYRDFHLEGSEQRVPLIFTSHGLYFEDGFTGRPKWPNIERQKAALGKTDCMIQVSGAEKRLAQKYGIWREDKDVVILNGVRDTITTDAHPLNAVEDMLNIGFVGRFVDVKGVDVLASALAQVERDDWVLHLIGGTAADATPVMAMALQGVPEDRVMFHGDVDNDELDDYLKDMDVVVVPSRYESFNLVVVEALRNSVPVIASDRGGPPELIETEGEGAYGYIFHMEHPEDWREPVESPANAAVLAEIIEGLDKETLRQMGVVGREAYEHAFTDEIAYGKVTEVYDAVVRAAEVGAIKGHGVI